jgi:Tfp pilus assembly protein FimT
MTLVELLVVVAIAALAISTTAVISMPMLLRESMRSASYDVSTHFQLARMEAVGRNVDCNFVIDIAQREIRVVDTKGTSSTTDDETIHEAEIDEAVSFARPDSGGAVTLTAVSGTIYQAVFNPEGTVSSGTGQVHMLGGTEYRRVELLGAGGVEIQRWDGTAWVGGG